MDYKNGDDGGQPAGVHAVDDVDEHQSVYGRGSNASWAAGRSRTGCSDFLHPKLFFSIYLN